MSLPTHKLSVAIPQAALIGEGRGADVYAWGPGRILKLYRSKAAAGWAEQEAAITRAVGQAGLPAPAVEAVIEVDGRPGIIFERVEGPTMLRAAPTRPWMLVRWARLLARLHAVMHDRSIPQLPSQRQQLQQQIRFAGQLSAELRQAALDALARLPDGTALCHGDFHPDNVLMSPGGPVIVDWDGATSGNPAADVARTSLMIRTGRPTPPTALPWLVERFRPAFHSLYMKRYARLRPADARQVAAWQLPVAAARLADCIPAEEPSLMAIVHRQALAARQPAGRK